MNIPPVHKKIDRLNQQAFEFRVHDFPRSLKYSEEALRLSRKARYKAGEAIAMRNLGFCYVRLANNKEAQPLLEGSLTLLRSMKDIPGQSLACQYLAVLHRGWGNFGKALEFGFRSIELSEQANSPAFLAENRYQVGITYKLLGQFEKALEYLFKASAYYEETNNPVFLSYPIQGIGSVYFENGDFERALEFFKQALKYRQRSGDKLGAAGSLDSLGFTYFKRKEYKKAIAHCTQSLSISKITKDNRARANAMVHLAEVYKATGNIVKAADLSGQSMQLRKDAGDKRGETELLLFQAGLYAKDKDPGTGKKVQELLKKALTNADRIKATDLQSKIHYQLYEWYQGRKEFEKALQHLATHSGLEKVHQQDTVNQKMLNLKIAYNAEQLKKETDAVKDRNAELTQLNNAIEANNRELEIEGALERVRSVAMGMKKPEDMLVICKVISKQLAGLGVKEIRNIQTAIFYTDRGIYTNYQYYAKHDRTFITDTDYTDHKVPRAFAAKMQKGKGQLSVTHIKGRQQLKDWIAYQKGTNVFIDKYLGTADYLGYYWYSLGPVAMGISTYRPLSKEEMELFQRFQNVFDLAYRRYLDIERAEAQAKEARIEAALEKVRAQAMGMHRPDDILHVCKTIYKELPALGFQDIRNVLINFWDDRNRVLIDYDYSDFAGGNIARLAYSSHPVFEQFQKTIRRSKDAFAQLVVKKDQLASWRKRRKASGEYEDPRLRKIDALYYYFYSIEVGSVGISAFSPLNEENLELLKRFRNVFNLAYRRYHDIEKAEAQAKEAAIELGLERVRARSMAMQSSEELAELVAVVFKELTQLGFPLSSSIIWIHDHMRARNTLWIASAELNKPPRPYLIGPFHKGFFNSIVKAWKSRDPRWTYPLAGKSKKIFEKAFYQSLPGLPVAFRHALTRPDKVLFSASFNNFGALEIVSTQPLNEEMFSILHRFGRVFDLSYTRFNDLKIAEAQTREGQVQLALERVRARTMAMQHSEELSQAVAVLFEQFKDLGEEPERMAIEIVNEQERVFEIWATGHGGSQLNLLVKVSLDEPHVMQKMYRAWKANKKSISIDLQGKALEEYFHYLKKLGLPVQRKIFGKRRVQNVATFSKGILTIITPEPRPPETTELLERFAAVFDGTYTRFLDLQKAEAQAREAEIELGLERVRARAMAMRNSDELKELIGAVFTELTKLDLALTRCIIWVFEPATHAARWWMANSEEPLNPMNFFIRFHKHPAYLSFVEAWKKQQVKLVYDLRGRDKVSWDKILFNETELAHLPGIVKNGMRAPERVLLSGSFNNFGGINTASLEPLSDEHFDILLRFAKVFDLTYTRFLDLQKAEAQAREAQIEAALERVRSRSMAMHSSHELEQVIKVLTDQLSLLGFHFHTANFITNESMPDWEIWISSPGQQMPPKIHVPYIDHPLFNERNNDLLKGRDMITAVLDKKEKNRFFRHMFTKTTASGTPEERKAWVFGQKGLAITTVLMKTISLSVLNYDALPYTTEENEVIKRMARVFEQSYTRFLDLQKAEAQAREAQIETALEKVRSRSIGMQKSEELKEVIRVVYEQFVHLNILVEHAGFIMEYKEREDMYIWLADKHEVPFQVTIPYFDCAHWNSFREAKKKGKDFFVNQLGFEEKNKFYQDLFALFPVPDEAKEYYFNCPGLAISTVLLDNVGLYIENFSGIPYTDEENSTLMRFGKVFQQTYTRFLDLERAEAQARESQIQLALERVRARTMAMQKSDELPEAANLLFQQVRSLGMPAWSTGYCTWDDDKKSSISLSMSSEGVLQPTLSMPLTEDPSLIHFREAWERGESFFVEEAGGEELKRHYVYLKTLPGVKETLADIEAAGFPMPVFQIFHLAYFSKGFLLFITYEPVPDAHDIFKRFGNVFEQTYTRFLDLQKAEAQTREAQIETGLERVRSKAMAMHSSEDLAITVDSFFAELRALQVVPRRCGVTLIDPDTRMADLTVTTSTEDGETKKMSGKLQLAGHPVLDAVFDNWTLQQEFHPVLQGSEIKEYYMVMNPQVSFPDFAADEKQYGHYFFFKEGGVFVWTDKELTEEMLTIFRKFTSVLSLTYRRYMDLVEAEAQARESQVEAALERVRSKTMAMHNSQEVGATVASMFEEMVKLDVDKTIRCGVAIFLNPGVIELWTAYSDQPGNITLNIGKLSSQLHPLLQGAADGWVNKETEFTYVLEGKDVIDYYSSISHAPDYPFRIDMSTLPSKVIHYDFYFSEGSLFAFSREPMPPATAHLFKRFAAVFGQTYRRYLDLQRAEAQAREAQVEAALERVRSRTLAMHKSDELAETAAVLFQQLIALGIEPNRLYISIIKGETADAEFWITDEDGAKVSTAFVTGMNSNGTLRKMYEGWKQQQRSLVIDMQGEELETYLKYLTSLGVPFKGGLAQKRRVQDIAYFSKGFIGMASPEEQPAETLQLLERFAAVFNLTFTRFNDLKIAEAHALQAEQDLVEIKAAKQKAEETLTELQATQKQLVQSEKMASLGELTAGIAHEIQNPLNFVNNFSEVSKELLQEMLEEVAKGNFEEVKALADDVKQNLEKINHHGKRADGIVKGMLQHSRTSSGQKELTDINALCDEYLRLAYHGLRAKDKSFNAKFETSLDPSVGKIQVMPQDMGRVILNLINNAFYAVSEKKASAGSAGQPYEPTVTVSTQRNGDMVSIRVKDNGNGIPQRVLDKIFQPFFTTKPTGQGTGLGLSLSYDIVKAHGGELKVKNGENEGAQFTIELPVS